MDETLELLADSPAGDDGGGVPSGGSTTIKSILTKEDNYKNAMDMCSEVNSSSSVGDEDLGDLELGLGLSIGGHGGGGGGGWGQYARILTAKDFSTFGSKQNNNNSSCSSSCSVSIPNSSTSGTKRSATGSVSPPNGNSVVGWPPVRKAHRMPSFANEMKSPTRNVISINEQIKSTNRTVGINDCSNERNKISDKKYLTVKVNMDGSLIGRKVDLNAHTSYEMLAQTLEEMFFRRRLSTEAAKPSRLLDGTYDFVLTYEDKDGDCMLVGDVPWQMFLSSVKRLRIMKNSDSNELAPRFQKKQ